MIRVVIDTDVGLRAAPVGGLPAAVLTFRQGAMLRIRAHVRVTAGWSSKARFSPDNISFECDQSGRADYLVTCNKRLTWRGERRRSQSVIVASTNGVT